MRERENTRGTLLRVCTIFPELGKCGAEAVLAACGFPENVRGETLGIPEFAAIANEICRGRAAK